VTAMAPMTPMPDDIAARARRRTGGIVAVAAVVLLVTAAAVVGLVVALGQRAIPVSQPTTPAPGTTRAGASNTAASAAAGSPAASTGADELSWTSVAGAKVPVSRADGPRDTAAGRARGFAHTPMGAVLAAAHISLRLSPQVGPAVFEPTLAEQVVGADQAALRAHLDDDYTTARAQLGVPYGAPAGRLYSTARGYRVRLVSDSADSADVGLLIEGPSTSGSVLIALSLHVRWVGGDWALVAPTAGDWNTAAQVITDPSGYTRFPDGS
jgi:hypothetical protein